MAADSLTTRTRTGPSRLTMAVMALNLAVIGYLGWRAFGPEDHGDPITTSLIAFEEANRLTVFSAQLAPVVSADDVRAYGLLKSRQVAVIPARVDYTIDLSKLDASRIRWDEAGKVLTVTLPPLEVSTPNLDEARAQYLREGVWITGPAQAKLNRDNTIRAQQQAVQQAHNPQLLELARSSGQQAVAQNLAAPLKAAGYPDIRVDVRFDK